MACKSSILIQNLDAFLNNYLLSLEMIAVTDDKLILNLYQTSNNILNILALHYLKQELKKSLKLSILNTQFNKLVIFFSQKIYGKEDCLHLVFEEKMKEML